MTTQPVLVIGSKNYSSWSLRPWLHLRKVGFEFSERIIHFDAPDYREAIAQASPSRRVPVLLTSSMPIVDSLAICEFASDVTEQGIPRAREARAFMRAAAAEMHAGFQALREQCPMNVRARQLRVPQTPALLADIARIDQVWTECRHRFGGTGAWLFGEFSIADAMYAPVVFRFQSYGATLSKSAQNYVDHALDDPLMREWAGAAASEGHALPNTDRIGAQAR